MLLSPRFFHGKLKNLFLLWKARRSAAGRRALLFYFNAAYYLARYPDVASTKVDPFWHYVLQGFKEGRSPSSRFNVRDYLRQYPDVALAGLNPLLHYAGYGKAENRVTSRSPYLALGASTEVPEDKRAILQNTQWPDGAPLVSVVTKKKFLGANYGFMLIPAAVANSSLDAPRFGQNPGAGFGDTYFQPVNLGWKFGRADE